MYSHSHHRPSILQVCERCRPWYFILLVSVVLFEVVRAEFCAAAGVWCLYTFVWRLTCNTFIALTRTRPVCSCRRIGPTLWAKRSAGSFRINSGQIGWDDGQEYAPRGGLILTGLLRRTTTCIAGYWSSQDEPRGHVPLSSPRGGDCGQGLRGRGRHNQSRDQHQFQFGWRRMSYLVIAGCRLVPHGSGGCPCRRNWY